MKYSHHRETCNGIYECIDQCPACAHEAGRAAGLEEAAVLVEFDALLRAPAVVARWVRALKEKKP